jgi:hypothetical protein
MPLIFLLMIRNLRRPLHIHLRLQLPFQAIMLFQPLIECLKRFLQKLFIIIAGLAQKIGSEFENVGKYTVASLAELRGKVLDGEGNVLGDCGEVLAVGEDWLDVVEGFGRLVWWGLGLCLVLELVES